MTPEEFQQLAPEAQATVRAGLLLQRLLADKDTASKVLPLVEQQAKKINPSYQTVEESAAPIVERVRQEFLDEFKRRDKKAEEDRARANLDSQVEAAKKAGFTDEGVSRVLQLMTDRGISDFDDARALYERQAAPALPRSAGASMDWNFYHSLNGDGVKDFFSGKSSGGPSLTENPDAWARSAALGYLEGRMPLPEV